MNGKVNDTKDGIDYLGFRCDYWFGGKLHLGCLQNCVLLEDVLLRLVMTKRLEEKQQQCCAFLCDVTGRG